MIIDYCSWDSPGANPYRGAPEAAVYSYADIPKPIQDRLSQRMSKRQYDDVAVIHGRTIEGKHRYDDLRDMHFGKNTVCRTVSRSGWRPGATEVGLVYCEEEHCLIVPTVCRNVSRVTRVLPGQSPTPTDPGGSGAGGYRRAYAVVDQSPVTFAQASQPPLVPYQQWWQPVVPIWYPDGPVFGDGWMPPNYPLPPAPPVPEPASYMMALAGIGFILLRLRKRG